MPDNLDRPAKQLPPEGCTDSDAETGVWDSGLEWGDVSLIRRQLDRTPTERLRAIQDLVNTALKIRTRNAT